ncbi:ATP-binding protein [Peptoniphilus sp. GNH]|nr:ATP-binding protein [Peptoniphilus sp. GNH]
MILTFTVGGFLSFNAEQTIEFIPYKGARLKNTKYEDNFHINVDYRPMKSLLLFGDNASGKTNWFYGLSRLKYIIKNGLADLDIDEFNKHSDIISFGISLMDKSDNIFEYDISFNKKGHVVYEELVKNNFKIFKFEDNNLRIYENAKNNEIKVLEKLFSKDSSNTLLLKLKDVLETSIETFFDSIDNIEIVTESLLNREIKGFPLRFFDEESKKEIERLKSDVISILKSLDSTIIDFKFIEKIIDDKDGHGFEMILTRENGDQFNLNSESLGIKKIIGLLPNMLQLYKGRSIFIDELDSSIGTKALIRLFNSFINSKNNISGQIVVSTHNLSLLDLDMFHDSQIYIANKNSNLSTIVHSLNEFELRSEKKRIDELYMRGSFEVDE